MSVNKELQELRISVVSHQSKVDEWMTTTTEYRKTLCEKIDKINDVLIKLPCKERSGWYSSINRQIKFLWGITGAVIIAIIAEWINGKK